MPATAVYSRSRLVYIISTLVMLVQLVLVSFAFLYTTVMVNKDDCYHSNLRSLSDFKASCQIVSL